MKVMNFINIGWIYVILFNLCITFQHIVNMEIQVCKNLTRLFYFVFYPKTRKVSNTKNIKRVLILLSLDLGISFFFFFYFNSKSRSNQQKRMLYYNST